MNLYEMKTADGQTVRVEASSLEFALMHPDSLSRGSVEVVSVIKVTS